MNKFIKVLTTVCLSLGISSVCSAAWADSNSAEVRLVATLNNNPAFQPVSWRVFRVDGRGEPVTSNRHSFTIEALPPGRYRAIARPQSGPEKHRDFVVMADTTNKINIPLD